MRVPFYGGPLLSGELEAVVKSYVERVLDEGWFVNGSVVRDLEARIAERTGVTHALGVGSASDGLLLLLDALGIGEGDEVIVPAYTFVSSATAIMHVGATPVFADVDPTTRNLLPAEIDRLRTDRTKAVMPVHMLLQMAPMLDVSRICEDLGLLVVEDSAEAIGMSVAGRSAGAWGAGGVLSFFPSKTLGARGDGGMVLTDDDEVADEVRLRRNHGDRGEIPYLWEKPGMNSRLDSVQAAILMASLDRLDDDIAERWQLADHYTSALEGVAGIDLPHVASGVGVPYVYLVEVDDRDGLAAALHSVGVETEVYYPVPLHLQPVFSPLGYRRGDLPNAERLCARALALPLYPGLARSAVDLVAETVAAHLAEAR